MNTKSKKEIDHFTRTDIYEEEDFPINCLRTHLHKRFRPHTHDFTEIHMITRGTVMERVNKEECRLVRGSVIILCGNDIHETTWAADAGGTLIRFNLDELNIPTHYLRNMPGYLSLFELDSPIRRHSARESVLQLDDQIITHAERIVQQLSEELHAKPDGYRIQAIALLLEFIVLLCREYLHTSPVASYHFLRVMRVIQYIEKNYEKELTLNELADVADMQTRNFSKVFRAATGHSPIDYLIRHRIANAMSLLRQEPVKIIDAAMMCGFSDSNYFARKFKSITHMTPTEYRQRMRSHSSE